MEYTNKVRITYISVAKGIGIILVVIGHCTIFTYLKNYIYLFHMPLFFFISGYLFLDDSCQNIFHYTIKKIKRLYIPFLLCNLFALIFHQWFCKIGIYSSSELFTSVGEFLKHVVKIFLCIKMEDIVAPLWFLPIMMVTSIIFALFRRMELILTSPAYCRHILIVLIYLLAFIMDPGGLKRAYILVALALLLFDLGYTAKQFAHFNIHKKGKYDLIIAICTFLVLLIGARYKTINMIQMRIGDPISFVFFSICGIYLTFYVAKNLTGWCGRVLAYCGDHSMIILKWHYYVFALVSVIQLAINQNMVSGLHGFVMYSEMYGIFEVIIWSFLYCFAGISIPIISGWVINLILKGRIERQLIGGIKSEKN